MPATVRQGDRGDDVLLAQQRLVANGYQTGGVDGIFGEQTERAVVQFQQSRGLVADGIVGPLTWSALLADADPDMPHDERDTERDRLRSLAGMTPTPAQRAVSEAVDFLGYREEPDGSNRGPAIAPLVDGYREYWKIGGSGGLPWCAMAVSVWIGRALDLGLTGRLMDWPAHPFGAWFGGCSQIDQWARNAGVYHAAVGFDAEPGDVFLMPRAGSSSDPNESTTAGHTGLVVCDNGDGTVTTIEGNTSNRVASKVRSKASLLAFVRWSDA